MGWKTGALGSRGAGDHRVDRRRGDHPRRGRAHRGVQRRGGADVRPLPRGRDRAASSGRWWSRRSTARRTGAGLRRAVATGRSQIIGRPVELTALRADGTEFPAEVTLSRLTGEGPPLFVGHVRDITERLAGEAAARRLAALVESSADAIVPSALDGRGRDLERGRRAHLRLRARGGLRAPLDELIVPPERRGSARRRARASCEAGLDRRPRPSTCGATGRSSRSRRRLGDPEPRASRRHLADRARHHRAPRARGAAAPGAEDGGGRAARGRDRARLQQPADGDRGLRAARPRARRRGRGRGRAGRDRARGRARRRSSRASCSRSRAARCSTRSCSTWRRSCAGWRRCSGG